MNMQFMGCTFESESQVCLHLTEDETPSGSPEEFTGFLASPRENAARPVLRGPSWAWSSVYDQSATWSPFPERLVDKRSTISCDKPAGSTALSWRPTLSPQDPSLSPNQYDRFGSVELMSGTRRKIAAQDATATLKAWLNEHRKNPYPTKGEKIMLAIITRMTLTQVSNWFANARRRLKKGEKGMFPSDENTACPEAVRNAGNGDEPREYEGVTDEELPLPNLQDFEAGFGDQNTSQTTVMESSSAPKRQMPGTLSTAELQSKRSLCFERSKSCHEMCDKTGVRTSEGKMFAAGGNFELCTGLSMINAQSHHLSYFVKPGDGGIEVHRGDDEQLASACMRSGQANLMLNTDVAHRDSLTKRVNSWSLAHPAVFCCHQPFSVSRESCSQPCKLRGWVDGELQAEPCQRRGMPMTHTTVPMNFVVSPNISTGCSTSKQVLACLPMSDILPPPFNSSAPTLKAD